ncbi:glycerophosphoInositol inositolphosphodiesterase [Acrasis kona]|uniref:GlycerophosphoInositol inositolphosphodiesterase n=1 Tax=Acrasis kona TaxID=1008807 RepID=A0AAW2ZLG4_9EUKA
MNQHTTVLIIATLLFLKCNAIETSQKSTNFLIFGHGGSPKTACENTLLSFHNAMREGANALEMDITISKDFIPFLSHDTDPKSPISTARRLGVGVPGICRPYISTLLERRSCFEMTFEEVQKYWTYTGPVAQENNIIPSFEDFAREMSSYNNLLVIYLDIKIPEKHLDVYLRKLINSVLNSAQTHQLRAKILWGTSSTKAVSIIQDESEIHKIPLEVNYSVEFVTKLPHDHKAVDKAIQVGTSFASPGEAFVKSVVFWYLKFITSRDVLKRDEHFSETGKYIGIISWTIDDQDQAKWLIKKGVDGIITNNVSSILNAIKSTK